MLVTGHSGFKGSWLALWLEQLGAKVVGFALPPPTVPAHIDLLELNLVSIEGDVRDHSRLARVIDEVEPEIVFHLAAQPLVRQSCMDPVETYATNVLGTVHLMESCRRTTSVRAIVNVTTDKCYENREWVWGYRESDPLGGHDPYSSSKACSEIVSAAYRTSFFHPDEYGKSHQCLVATARAGNVIGGGDWAEDRLIPDIVRALEREESLVIRSPGATRPWQHVLEPLSGYLLLGQRLLEERPEFAQAWNFGPDEAVIADVQTLVRALEQHWPSLCVKIDPSQANIHEAGLLKLDSSRAHALLGWRSRWDLDETVRRTARWYRRYLEQGQVTSLADLQDYSSKLQDC